MRHKTLDTRRETQEGWVASLKGKQFKLGGELEFEYVDTQDDEETDSPAGHFQIDKFTLKPHILITDNIVLEGLLLFKADKAYVSEAYAVFSGLPLSASLKIGLDDRFIDEKPGRKTEGFSLIDTAFARDDEFAMTWVGQQRLDRSITLPGLLYWTVSLSNGLALGQQAPSEDRSHKLIHDNRQTSDMNQNKEIGFGLGWRHSFAPTKDDAGRMPALLDVFVFAYAAKLSQEDIDFLQSVAGYGTSESDTNSMYGASMEYRLKGLSFGGKYIWARDGALDRYGWFTQASYKIDLGRRKLFTAISPLVRYGRLRVDLPNIPTDPLTWDREMTTLALLTEVAKDLMLKTEYYLNGETTGGDDVNNDEFLMQLEIKF